MIDSVEWMRERHIAEAIRDATDIVKRLRKLAKLNAIGEGAAIVHKKGLTEAADEIERLREANRRWSKVADERAIEVAELRAAIERLRRTLLNRLWRVALRMAAAINRTGYRR
jgi:hypothetical protein